jgi:excisionase family DNA binding protein
MKTLEVPDWEVAVRIYENGIREGLEQAGEPPGAAPALELDPLLVGLPQAARSLGVSERTMRRLAKINRVRPVRIGRRLLFKPTDLAKVQGAPSRRP